MKRKISPASVPVGDPIEGHWQRLFSEAEHWQSDLAFFNDEIKFFRELISLHFEKFTMEANFAQYRLVAHELLRLYKARGNLAAQLTTHLQHLGELIENPFPYEAGAFTDEHNIIRTAVKRLGFNLRAIKRDLYRLAERAIDSEKLRHD